MFIRARLSTLKAKIIALSCAFAIVASACVVLLSRSQSEDVLSKSQLQAHMSLETQKADMRLEEDFLDLVEDAYILANSTGTRTIVAQMSGGETTPERANLERIFSTYMQIRPVYTQIRLIGFAQNGKEIVRVNRTPTGLEVVDASALQEKGSEAYLRGADTLKPGDTRFSHVSLNREHGAVSADLTPTVRLLMPVFTDAGEPFGVILINANYAEMLRTSLESIQTDHKTYVFNQAGDLATFDPHSARFNFYFAADIPQEAGTLLADIRSAREAGENFLPNNFYSDGSRQSFGRAKGLELTVAMAIPENVIAKDTAPLYVLALSVMAFCLLLAILYARAMTRPLQTMTRRLSRVRDYSDITTLALPTDARDEIGDLARAFTDLIQQLNEHRARTEKIVSNVVDGIIVIDERGIVESFNPACERLFGYRANEVIGKPVSILMPYEDAVVHHRYLQKYQRTGDTKVIGKGRELRAKRKDGEEFVFDMSVSDIQERGQQYFCGIIRDLTETLQSRSALRKQTETLQFALDGGELGL